jgi:hypothetical protein
MTGAFSHDTSAPNITINVTGTYDAGFIVLGLGSNQFAFFLNGAALPGGIYGTGTGNQGSPGQIVFSANAGDVLTIRNHSSSLPIALQLQTGGSQINANASVRILKIG